MRSFEIWKAQITNYLITVERDNQKFQQQKYIIIAKLRDLRSRWLSRFLVDLYTFANYWGLMDEIKKYLPTDEEIENWMVRE